MISTFLRIPQIFLRMVQMISGNRKILLNLRDRPVRYARKKTHIRQPFCRYYDSAA